MITQLFCQECDDTAAISGNFKFCQICGALLRAVPRCDNNDELTQANEPDLRASLLESHFFRDFFQSDLFQAIETSVNLSRNKKLSTSFLKTLGKVIVDTQHLILHDLYLEIESIKLLAIPAEFNDVRLLASSSNLMIAGEPICGLTDRLINEQKCTDKFIYMKRGEISFVSKALTAQAAGGRGVIIGQTYDMWPFMMTDSTHELSKPHNSALRINASSILNIPVVMISKEDSERVESLLSSASAKNLTLRCKLVVGEKQTQCPVCCDNMVYGDEVLKLPCRHIFHSECIFKWLDNHYSCPMCRHSLANENNQAEGTDRNNFSEIVDNNESRNLGDASSQSSHRQSYFV